MRTLYLDCGMGAAGDMLTAALLMLADDREGFLRRVNAALGGMAAVSCAQVSKCGVQGLHVTVSVGGDVEGKEPRHRHEHTSIGEIRALLAAAPVSEKVRADARAVFDSLAAAEAAVHGQEMENISRFSTVSPRRRPRSTGGRSRTSTSTSSAASTPWPTCSACAC